MKKVMIKAWEIARNGQEKFGGKVSEYFAEALKMAWALIKKGVNKMANDLKVIAREIEEAFMEESITVQANVWEKYGKRRIYINAGYGLKAGYFEFDQDGNFDKAFGEYSDWDMGKTSAQFKVIRDAFAGGYF